MYMYMCICIYIYIYIYTHTHNTHVWGRAAEAVPGEKACEDEKQVWRARPTRNTCRSPRSTTWFACQAANQSRSILCFFCLALRAHRRGVIRIRIGDQGLFGSPHYSLSTTHYSLLLLTTHCSYSLLTTPTHYSYSYSYYYYSYSLLPLLLLLLR